LSVVPQYACQPNIVCGVPLTTTVSTAAIWLPYSWIAYSSGPGGCRGDANVGKDSAAANDPGAKISFSAARASALISTSEGVK
jgi:hypothetical protein